MKKSFKTRVRRALPVFFTFLQLSFTCAANSTDSLDIKIGQMIMIGINDRTQVADSDVLLAEIRGHKLGGIVLFEKNIAQMDSKNTLQQMIKALQSPAQIPLLVTIDEEGGKVHRLKEKYGFVAMPSAAYLGNLDNADSTFYYNNRLAAELAELGFNFNYAPSVDLAVNPQNTVIVQRERSFSARPDLVSKHALLCIKAHHQNGVKTILKHFPGHGSSNADSHHGIVEVTETWDFQELFPYSNILRSGSCDAIMTAHIINRNWDNSLLPATLSKKVIDGILRGLLRYNGVVFSDDMQMHAISKEYGLDNALALAINAGVDIVMFANNVSGKDKPVSATEVHSRIRKLVKTGKIPQARINESYNRIRLLKNKTL
ncbi:MAG TPA: glycoside hydrolase family 3 N-terminal domain-containing protein [Chitinophagaceae bacterium]|nr:glycoside hydrolase family 3 N-terminal domain-containing protein [Chitinophagaceae bacterium]